MDIYQFDTDSAKNQKKCDRKYSQSSQSSTSGVNAPTVSHSNSDQKDDITTTSSHTKSGDTQEGCTDLDEKTSWRNSGNSTILNKTSLSNFNCNNDNSTIDSTLKSKCDSGNSAVNQSACGICPDIKAEVKEETNDTSHLIPNVSLPPHVVSKLNVSLN